MDIRNAGQESGMEKAAELDTGTVMLGLGAAGFGGLSIYDMIKSRGLDKDSKRVVESIQKKKQVDSSKFVKKFDKKIKVLSTYSDMERAMINEFGKRKGRDAAMGLWPSVENNTNAFAMRGMKGEYIGAGKRANADALAHEIGHILDFRARNINVKNMGPYSGGLASMIWRPSYNKSTMNAERRAWKLAPERKGQFDLERDALATYDKSFHSQRAGLSGLTAMAFLSIIMNQDAYR